MPLGLIVAMVVIFSGRLFDLQVLSAATINEEADGRRGVVNSLWTTRGAIVDAEGKPLATSVDRFDITIAPVNMVDFNRSNPKTGETEVVTVDDSLQRIASITGQDAKTMRAEIDAILAEDPESNFAYLAHMVPLEQYQEIRKLRIPWVYPQPHPKRSYPAGAVAGNIVGFSDAAGAPLAGLELQYDKCLSGVNGKEMYERSADGVAIPGTVVTVEQPRPGGTLELTINSDVQYRVQQILADQVNYQQAEYGTITVVNVKTGEIVAAAEYPTVDPNVPTDANPEDRGNRTFGAALEPGSIMKPLTAAMLYDQGKVDPHETITVPDQWPHDDADFGDDEAHAPIEMNLNGVIAVSSNVGMAEFGARLPREARYDYMRKFGLGEQTAVDFNGEAAGTVHNPEDWDNQTNYTVTFGQGLTATAAQMASAYQAIGNGGKRLPLKLVRGCRQEDGTLADVPGGDSVQVVSPQAARFTIDGMEAMARAPGHEDLAVPGYRVATKSGTAQTVNPDTGTYYVGSYYTTMAGLAPADDPQFAVLVGMYRPTRMVTGSGSTPVAWQQTMSYVLAKYQVPPSPEPYPEIDARY